MTTAESTMIGRLKLVRQELGLSQDEFARGAGIGKSSLKNMEQGIQKVSDKTIRKIYETYDVSEKWLRSGEGRMFVDDHGDAADNRRDAFNFFARVFNLPPDKQLQLAAFAGYDIDAAEIYAQSNDAAKRKVARLVKAIDRGAAGYVKALL